MMKFHWLACLVMTGWVGGCGSHHAESTDDGESAAASGRFRMSVDGRFSGFIRKVPGGTVRGARVRQAVSFHAASSGPVTLEMSMGAGKPMWDWVKASFEKGFVSRNLNLNAGSPNPSEAHIISAVTVPAHNVMSDAAHILTLHIEPVASVQGALQTYAQPSDDRWVASNFRLHIDGLPTDRVLKIASFRWAQSVQRDASGAIVSTTPLPTRLKVTLDATHHAAWAGHTGPIPSGALTLLGPDLQEELATISLKHVDIISLEQKAPRRNGLARFDVELQVQEIAFDVFSR